MPASGASMTRFGIVIPPSSQGSWSERTASEGTNGGRRPAASSPPRPPSRPGTCLSPVDPLMGGEDRCPHTGHPRPGETITFDPFELARNRGALRCAPQTVTNVRHPPAPRREIDHATVRLARGAPARPCQSGRARAPYPLRRRCYDIIDARIESADRAGRYVL